MKAGNVYRLARAASPQFMTPVLFRLIRVHDWPTYDGWAWLDGYELDALGDAVERRSVFVLRAGVQAVAIPAVARLAGRQARRRAA